MNLKKTRLVLLMILICLTCNQTRSQNLNSKNSNDSKPSELFHIPYTSSGTLKNPVMLLVLHGDSPFNNPSYQYLIASRIANESENVVAVGILRPGYTDKEGNYSKGKRGKATGDNYTKEVLMSIKNLT